MNPPFALIALCAGVLCLGACDKTPTDPPTPMVDKPVATAPGVTGGPASDPSLPSAESVLSQGNVTKADPTPVRSDGTRNPGQDATATPLPGQNNDHSAPISSARPASTPQ